MPTSILQPTGVELAPTGTINLPAIVMGNFELINDYLKTLSGGNGLTTISYAASINLPIATSKPLVQCSVTGDMTIAVTEKAAGYSRMLTLIGDGTNRALTWPVGAVWAGDSLDTLPSGSTRIIFIEARGTENTDLVLCQLGGGGGSGGGSYIDGSVTPIDKDDARGVAGDFSYDEAAGYFYRKVSADPDPEVWIRWSVENNW